MKLFPKYSSLVSPGDSVRCMTDMSYPLPTSSWKFDEFHYSARPFEINGDLVTVDKAAELGTIFHLICEANYQSPFDTTTQILTKHYIFTVRGMAGIPFGCCLSL